jgi:hypothetical protein
MGQIVRLATAADDGVLIGHRLLICDRDRKWGRRLIPIGERHFRRAVAEFIEHYHGERNHQGLDNRLIAGTPAADTARPVRGARAWEDCSITTSVLRDQPVGRDVEQYGAGRQRKIRCAK